MTRHLARILLTCALLVATYSAASAQGNVICPTAAPGTSDNRCASTAFVQNAIGGGGGITALTGDVTASGSGSVATTLATVNANVGSFGSATQASQITVNAKGLITAAANVTVTPAVGSITGLGTGVATALSVNVGSAGAFVTFNGAGGTPASMVGTNITGTAAGLTAGNVTTNANLTGDVTSIGNATTLANIPTGVPVAGTMLHTNVAAPSSPAAGKVLTWSDSTDLRFHDKNSSGVIGTTVVADTGAASNYISAISAAGVISKSRPACATLSDSSTGCSTTVGTMATQAASAVAITGGTIAGLTGLAARDTSAAFDVTQAYTSTSATLTAGRIVTYDVGNVAHTVKYGTTANTITFPNLSSFTVITNGDTGSVTNTMLAGSIDLTSKVTNALPGVNGGTGLATAAIGDIMYASATTPTWSRLADVATGSVLVSGGVNTAPSWASNFSAGTITASLTGHASLDCALAGCTMTGTMIFSADNTFNIGASAATRPAHVYVGTDVTIAAGSAITSSGPGGALASGAFTTVGTIATQAANSVTITGGTLAGLTGLAIRDTSAAFDVTIAAVSNTALTAGRTITINMQNVAHILTLGTTANTGSGIIFPNTATDTVAMLGIANAFTAANTIASSSANAFSAGLTTAHPAFNVDASTASQTAGFNVKGAALNGTVALAVIDTSGNTNLTINALGSGTIGIGSVSTGAVTITPATTHTGLITANGSINLASGQNIQIGTAALLWTAGTNSSTVLGVAAGGTVTGINNTAVGNLACAVLTSSAGNTCIGQYALGSIRSASGSNTGVGVGAGYEITGGISNTIVGNNTGRGIASGSYNTVIGASVSGLSASLANAIIIADGQGNPRFDYGYTTASVNTITGALAVTAGYKIGAVLAWSNTAPTIASGFGTSPSVTASNGTAAFKINVGTGGTATGGVVTMPAATTGWNCSVTPAAAPQAAAIMYSVATSGTSITITNYTATTGVALAWTASTIIAVECTGF
jgi:hypothetical protein